MSSFLNPNNAQAQENHAHGIDSSATSKQAPYHLAEHFFLIEHIYRVLQRAAESSPGAPMRDSARGGASGGGRHMPLGLRRDEGRLAVDLGGFEINSRKGGCIG